MFRGNNFFFLLVLPQIQTRSASASPSKRKQKIIWKRVWASSTYFVNIYFLKSFKQLLKAIILHQD